MEDKFSESWTRLLEKIAGWGDQIIYNIPNVLIAIITFVVAYWLSRRTRSLVNKFLKKIVPQQSVRTLIANVSSVVIIMFGMILVLSIMNLEGTLKSMLAGAGVAGIAIGLALQGTLSNTFSGISLALKSEINVGDWVETNGFSGRVIEIELRNTKILQSDNKIVVIPNKMIFESPFKNLSLNKRMRSSITCGVGYGSNLKEVRRIALKAIENIFEQETGEEIEFFYTEFGDSSINFILRYWVSAKDLRANSYFKSEAIIALKAAFDENNINIPFPIRTLIHQNNITEETTTKE